MTLVYCGQRVGWIRLPLGMEVGLGSGQSVRWGPRSLPKGAQQPPQLLVDVYCGQTARWIKMPIGTEVCLSPSHIVLDGDPAPPRKGHSSPSPLFGRCLLWPNGRPSQQLLSCCLMSYVFAYRNICLEEIHRYSSTRRQFVSLIVDRYR